MADSKTYFWARFSDEQLLELRLCDLGLRLEQTQLPRYIERLYRELERKRLLFRPHFWLSNEWFTPDGVAGCAIPFYLAHPRLLMLEMNQVCEAEGGDAQSLMRLLRHECGHAVENAYRLRRLRLRRALFGKSTAKYSNYYHPRPFDRKYVVHLNGWYAQSHPDEDFAETFAVWLTPGSDWRRRYVGWEALRKLDYVDSVMRALAGQRPLHLNRARQQPLSGMRITLREHYRRRRAYLGVDATAAHLRGIPR